VCYVVVVECWGIEKGGGLMRWNPRSRNELDWFKDVSWVLEV